MAVKGVGLIVDVEWGPAGFFNIQLKYMVFGPTQVWGQINIVDLAPALTALTFEETIKTAFKNHLTSEHGVTFGLLDTVHLIGAAL